jgi:hypothetical protein
MLSKCRVNINNLSFLNLPERKKKLVRPRLIWDYNIKKDLKERGWDGVDWINLVQNNITGGIS